jgi:hypothetical protein
MGYTIMQGHTDFCIKESNFSALRAIIDKYVREAAHISEDPSEFPEDLSEYLSEAMDLLIDYDAALDNPDLVHVELGERIHEQPEMFNIIAPVVEKGSYIECSGEDGLFWRYYFDGKRCVEQDAVSWAKNTGKHCQRYVTLQQTDVYLEDSNTYIEGWEYIGCDQSLEVAAEDFSLLLQAHKDDPGITYCLRDTETKRQLICITRRESYPTEAFIHDHFEKKNA